MKWSFDIHHTGLAAEGAVHPAFRGFRVIVHFLHRLFVGFYTGVQGEGYDYG